MNCSGVYRCTCVEDEAGEARTDCVIADDDQFCRCVVNNNGDTSQVSPQPLLC